MAQGDPVPEQFRNADAARRIALVASSFESLLGEPLMGPCIDAVAGLWRAPSAILAHGTEADPIFFFANRRALEIFEYDIETILHTPSRLSAEAPLREERQKLLDRVSSQGFIDDYSGIRIAATGRRFEIERAIVWNLIDGDGATHGQAATFNL
ncbi:MAG: MEKHLA domain-containing protein [Novosphingobium sp.]|nr:MEKHLA domain-containing protein [Novosphingobium sp.]